MQAGVIVVSGAAFALLVFVLVGGPMILVDWSRKRRRMAIERQIALTDALDGRLGSMVSPVVTKPLWGPWEVQIAVPFTRSAAVGRILSVVDGVFSRLEGTNSPSYRIVLDAKQRPIREARAPRARGSAKRWAGGPVAAA
jgi:hypothetical protein